MCCNKRRQQQPAMAGQMTVLSGRTCGHTCSYGCRSGCGHPCEKGCGQAHSNSNRSRCGAGCRGGFYGTQGRCGHSHSNARLLTGVVMPLVQKAIESHNEKSATPLSPQVSLGVKDEKSYLRRSSAGSAKSDLSDAPPPYSASAQTLEQIRSVRSSTSSVSSFFEEEQKTYPVSLSALANIPHTAEIEQEIIKLTNAIIARHYDSRVKTRWAAKKAAKNLAWAVEEEYENRGYDIYCSERRILRDQVEALADQIENAFTRSN